jgi:hypothetical protein
VQFIPTARYGVNYWFIIANADVIIDADDGDDNDYDDEDNVA